MNTGSNNTTRVLIALLCAAGLSPLFAQQDDEVPTPDLSHIIVRVSESLLGRVIEVVDDKVIVELAGHTGSRVGVPFKIVPVDTLFEIEDARIRPGNVDELWQLEAFAKKHSLHLRRMEVLERIAALQPDQVPAVEAGLDDCREHCSADRLSKAREFRDAGELDRSMSVLRDIVYRYEGCIATEEAKSMMSDVEADLQVERQRAWELARQSRGLRSTSADFEDIDELIEEGQRLVTEARMQLDEFVKATNVLLKAERAFSAALRLLDRYSEARPVTTGTRSGDAVAAPSGSAHRRLVAESSLFEVHIELGHIYIARGNRTSAYRHAGMAAAIDPNDWRVVSLRAAIAGSP